MPLALQALRGVNAMLTLGMPFDTDATYLPLARRLLENPSAFFASEEAFSVAPGNYIFMALHGANIHWLKISDLALSMLVLLLLFDAGHRLAGRWAGAAAAWLYAASPLLTQWSILPQSEPLYFTSTMLWLWSAVFLSMPYRSKTQSRPTAWLDWLVATGGGIALGIATLTRGTYMYWIPVAILVCMAMFWFARSSMPWLRPLATRLLLVHVLAFSIVGGWIAHNERTFGKAAIAAGAGVALYFGNNPVLGGYEPPYLGLRHDNDTATLHSHLSIEGDRRLQATAVAMLRETPASVSFPMYWQKLGAFLFFSKVHIARHIANERAWRILLLSLAVVGGWSFRRHPVGWLLVGAVVYQTIVHLPVQYNVRYSVGAIDLPLTLLAGAGVASLARSRRATLNTALGAAVVALGILVGAWHHRFSSPVMPALTQGPHQRIKAAQTIDIETSGLQGEPFGAGATVTGNAPSITWKQAVLSPRGIAIVKLGVIQLPKACNTLTSTFNATGEPPRQIQIRLEGRAPDDDITYGSVGLVHQNTEGTLKLAFECPLGAVMHFDELASYAASMGQYYGARVE